MIDTYKDNVPYPKVGVTKKSFIQAKYRLVSLHCWQRKHKWPAWTKYVPWRRLKLGEMHPTSNSLNPHTKSPLYSLQLQNAVSRHSSKMSSLKNALGFNISSCCCPGLISLGKAVLAVLIDLGRIPTDHCSFQSLFHELLLSQSLPSYITHKLIQNLMPALQGRRVTMK